MSDDQSQTEREIAAALLRMLDADQETRPFVIVEERVTDERRFVQFCTRQDGNIVFDVPELALTWVSFASDCGSRNVSEVVDGAALLGVLVLAHMGIEDVRIIEGKTTAGGTTKGAPL